MPCSIEEWKDKMGEVRGWDDIVCTYDERLFVVIGSLPGFDPCHWCVCVYLYV